MALSLVAATSCPMRAQETIVYDAYITGVHLAELTANNSEDGVWYTIRRRNPRTNTWSSPNPTQPSSSSGEDIRLWGAIRDLPSQLSALEAIDWSQVHAVGWPDKETLFIRHREVTTTVGNDVIRARHWAEHDASQPMDLVIGDGNQILAGIDPGRDMVLVRRGYEDLTTVGRWKNASISPASFGFEELGKFRVRSPDGDDLMTLVYLPSPDTAGPYPTILIRTPYGISNLIDQYWQYAVRGYAVVLQAARGTAYWDQESRSDGEWVPMINEPADGAAALEWITAQEWSNGDICMQGASYVAYTQWAATMADNPALKCIVPESSMGTAFSDQPYMGGGFVEGLAYYAFWMLDIPILPNRQWSDILQFRPLIDLDEYATGQDVPTWNTMLEQWSNNEYWKRQDWYDRDLERRFASFQISGWFDDDFPGTEANWNLMQREGTLPQRLLIGPWRHGYNNDRRLNGFSFGADAVRDDIWLLKQQWYDHHLKGRDTGVEARVVEYFVLGDNEWRRSTQWPPPEAVKSKWFFHSTGSANRSTINGTLSTTPPAATVPYDGYQYDPSDPPSNWKTFDLMESWEDVQSFPYDFKDIEGRHDVVTFTSTVLEEDVTVAGDILIELYASTDALDTDWWVHLADVHPDGESVRLSVGMLRARFRGLEDPDHHITGSNFETEELLSGNMEEIVRYRISIPSVANTFKAGHQIRIAVMNALDRYSFPNSNTGGDEAYVTETVIGTMRIHHAANAPSHVLLPVLPGR